MQIDMHFYGTYAIARTAGFSPDEAKIIATAAQFVDDAIAAEPVDLNGLAYLLPVVTAHTMYELAENSDVMDQWRVWLPFHFLPGGLGNRVEDKAVCAWGEPDNPAAESIIGLALGQRGENHALHLLGIITHVLQDTYAHYGFSGFATDRNKIMQSTLESDIHDLGDLLDVLWGKASGALAEASRLGHASVSTCPDIPHLAWRFRYEDRPNLPVAYNMEDRDNKRSFYLSCTRLLAVYQAFREGKAAVEVPGGHVDFEPQAGDAVNAILALEDNDADDRGDMWVEQMASGNLFTVSDEDRGVRYDDAEWRFETMRGNPGATMTHAFQFNQAAALYLNHVHNTVLTDLGILSRL